MPTPFAYPSRPRPMTAVAMLFAAVFVSLFIGRTAAAAPDQGKPNIVVILLDDSGFSDLGCYGSEIRTPNIDQLAQTGLRFTRFYNCSKCCPTRASLLTGLYPQKVNMYHNGLSLGRNGVTIAEALKTAGYQTAMTGKWHLSAAPTLSPPKRHLAWVNHQILPDRQFGPIDSYPIHRGFDRFYGMIWGVFDKYDPFSLVQGDKPVKTVPKDFYITDALGDHAVQYIDEMAKKKDPFFMYVSFSNSHWPLMAPQKDIDAYNGQYDDGWEALHRERYERQVKMGLLDPKTHPLSELVPNILGEDQEPFDRWDQLSEDKRKLAARLMQTQAAMITKVDDNVGRIIKTLKSTGRYDNTLILLLSDNGASAERWIAPGYDRPSETRYGKKIRYKNLKVSEVGKETAYAYLGQHWGNALNTPFRYFKNESYEGGEHTPMIAHWPDGLKTKNGAITRQTGHVIDLLPTCLDAAGIAYPKSYQGHDLTPLDGQSLLPILEGKQRRPHKALYFAFSHGKAIITADGWKAVQPTFNNQWHLFHLATDATETHDLAKQNPQKLQELIQQWKAWADEVGNAY